MLIAPKATTNEKKFVSQKTKLKLYTSNIYFKQKTVQRNKRHYDTENK